MRLVALQTKTTKDFEKNLSSLKKLIKKSEKNSLILAPELALTGFCYDKMEEAALFTKKAVKELLDLSENKIIALTFITKKQDKFLNTLYIFFNKKIVHTQSKVKLFPLGDEPQHFVKGEEKDIKIIEINGAKIAVLICFELRFPKLWQKILGADIILNPAMWGKKREEHYASISKTLALVNQCFVLCANSANSNMARKSAIISPFGKVLKDDRKQKIEQKIDLSEIKLVRKYINIGLNDE